MTIDYKPSEMKKRIFDLACDFASAGIDGEKSILFVQSQVPEHTELAWIFNTITPMGELERMTQFKEKSFQNKKNVNAGLFTYPILMAADILLYKADMVPAGEDQVQHIELARDIAKRFNKKFGKIFPEPMPRLEKSGRIMSPSDPSKKMSKSLGEKHYIALTDSEKTIRQKIKSAVTDSGKNGESKGVKNLFSILESLDAQIAKSVKEEQKNGTLKYSDLKEIVSNTIISHLKPFQERRKEFEKNPEKIAKILSQGADAAREIASKTISEVRTKTGIRI